MSTNDSVFFTWTWTDDGRNVFVYAHFCLMLRTHVWLII